MRKALQQWVMYACVSNILRDVAACIAKKQQSKLKASNMKVGMARTAACLPLSTGVPCGKGCRCASAVPPLVQGRCALWKRGAVASHGVSLYAP